MRPCLDVTEMTCKEYIDAYQKAGYDEFLEHFWPESVNGEWTIDGAEWYPCVILDDQVPKDTAYVVTRNQSHIHIEALCVRRTKN